MRYVVAITGASGAIYGIRLLQELEGERILVISKTAREIIPAETDYTVEQVEAGQQRDPKKSAAKPAGKTDWMDEYM